MYEYNFCFFGKFKQGETVLGEFKNWGSNSNKIEQKNLNEFDDDIGISAEFQKPLQIRVNLNLYWLNYNHYSLI